MFYVNKRVTNFVKGRLKKLIVAYRESLENLEELESLIRVSKNTYESLVPAIDLLNNKLGFNIPYTKDKNIVIEAFAKVKRDARSTIDMAETIIKTLKITGFEDVTFSLPFFCIQFCFDYPGILYLTLTGIKINALKKNEANVTTELEKALWSLEKQMAEYLDYQLFIDEDNIVNFTNLFKDYLLTYHENAVDREIRFFDIDRVIVDVLVALVNYVLYSKLRITVDEDSVKEHIFEERTKKDANDGQIVDKLIKNYLRDLSSLTTEEKDKSLVTSKVKESRLTDYVVDGHITRLCEIDEFQEMLLEARVPASKREKYIVEMQNLRDRVYEELFARKMDEYREWLFSKDEKELYKTATFSNFSSLSAVKNALCKIDEVVETAVCEITPLFEDIKDSISDGVVYGCDRELYAIAKRNGDVSNKIEDIDMILEMIKGDLSTWFDVLRKGFSYGVEIDNRKNVVYYTGVIKDVEGEPIALPQILLSLLYLDKSYYSLADVQLANLIDHNNLDIDKTINRSLPYPVYVKGRDYKVFYTFIEDTLVVIDGLEANGDEYKIIISLVRSEKFKEYMESLKTRIASGQKPNAQGYTELIKKELKNVKPGKRKEYN